MALSVVTGTPVQQDNVSGRSTWQGWALLTAVDPTTSYAAAGTTGHVPVAGADLITLIITRVHSSATSIEWKVEWSYDGTNFSRTVNKSVLAGAVTNVFSEDTIAAGASILTWTDSFTPQAPYFRVLFKRTGGAAGDTVAAICVVRSRT